MMKGQRTNVAGETLAMDAVLGAMAEVADEQVRARVLRWVTDGFASDRGTAARYVAAARATETRTAHTRSHTRRSRHHDFAEEFQRLAARRSADDRTRSAA